MANKHVRFVTFDARTVVQKEDELIRGSVELQYGVAIPSDLRLEVSNYACAKNYIYI